MGRAAGWPCDLVQQFFDLQRPRRHLSGRPVRPPGAARQGHRQGAAGASRRPMRGERLVAPAMVGAGLEYAVDRILQIDGRGADERVDGVSGHRSSAGGAGEGDTLMEVVFVVAVAENGVIGAGGAMPWRLKSDVKRFVALTLN